MRNRICLALGVFCTLAGTPSFAQVRTGSVMERKVTVTFNQAPLESVLRTLHRQYGVRISYSNTALNLRQPVTLSVQNQPLRAVLDQLLRDKNIGYELVGDQIVLHPAPAKPRSAPKPTTGVPTISKAATDRAAGNEPATPTARPNKAAASQNKQPATAQKPTAAPTTATTHPKPTDPKAPAANDAPPATPISKPAAGPQVDSAATVKAAQLQDSVATAVEAPADNRPTYTKKAQVSFFGPLGSNGLRSGQTVNTLSLNVLGGYATGVEGFEAAGLINVDRDTVSGVQVAGLANVVGRHLNGFQGAGLLNVLGGEGKGWQAAGLSNIATRPIAGVQTAGLFNYAGPAKAPVTGLATEAAAPTSASPKTLQAAGLFNLSLHEVHGTQVAGLLNAAGTVHGLQLAGLVNIADSVDGVSIAPFNLVRHGYHRFEVTNSETWPVGASLKLGGSAAFYTFFAGAYDGFGSGQRRWALGYGVGTEVLARHRISVNLDAVSLHVNEEQQGWTPDLNLHNQLRLLVGIAPLRAGGHLRIVGGPTVSVLVTQRFDTAEQRVYSNLSSGRKLWLDEGSSRTRVLGWVGYSVGLRF
ncbi:DUF4974 domain-containing protein [Hymenobacter wooponensis]|uniref:DUF4974 domain-containing protein n=1 Tax=Hymenobacter wooponensis TaxID=1525360 RepID=A0A4Z0MJI9_9BACT|nr:DUF4974 domain-containing protein [Hymenobacter wooponensis]TGD79681.1 DUF4974 domain-containing protein [Hymenobacter wooponensis]